MLPMLTTLVVFVLLHTCVESLNYRAHLQAKHFCNNHIGQLLSKPALCSTSSGLTTNPTFVSQEHDIVVTNEGSIKIDHRTRGAGKIQFEPAKALHAGWRSLDNVQNDWIPLGLTSFEGAPRQHFLVNLSEPQGGVGVTETALALQVLGVLPDKAIFYMDASDTSKPHKAIFSNSMHSDETHFELSFSNFQFLDDDVSLEAALMDELRVAPKESQIEPSAFHRRSSSAGLGSHKTRSLRHNHEGSRQMQTTNFSVPPGCTPTGPTEGAFYCLTGAPTIDGSLFGVAVSGFLFDIDEADKIATLGVDLGYNNTTPSHLDLSASGCAIVLMEGVDLANVQAGLCFSNPASTPQQEDGTIEATFDIQGRGFVELLGINLLEFNPTGQGNVKTAESFDVSVNAELSESIGSGFTGAGVRATVQLNTVDNAIVVWNAVVQIHVSVTILGITYEDAFTVIDEELQLL